MGTAFDDIRGILDEVSKAQPKTLAAQTSGGLINLERQGYKNLWFSRAGQYDKTHGGTYGNEFDRGLLAQLDSAPLGFKPQISAGYANIGHSNGKGGEHVNPGVFDIGLSGRTPAQAQQLKQLLTSQGVPFLEEGSGTSNWHLHVRGNRAGQPKEMLAKAPQGKNTPAAPPQDLLLPLTQDDNGNIITRDQKPGVTAAEIERYVKANQPEPVQLSAPANAPAAPAGSTGSDFDTIREILNEAANRGKKAGIVAGAQAGTMLSPVLHPPASGLLQRAGNVVKAGWDTSVGMANQAVDAMINEQGLNSGEAALDKLATVAGNIPEGVRGVLQFPNDIGTGIRSAWMGHEEAPLYELPHPGEMLGYQEGLNQLNQKYPASALLGQVLGMEGVGRGVGKISDGQQAAASTRAQVAGGLQRRDVPRVQQPGITPGEMRRPQYGFREGGPADLKPVYQGIQPAARRFDRSAAPARPELDLLKPQESAELARSFEERQRPADPAQVIDPRNAEIPQELGTVKTEAGPGGLEIVTRDQQAKPQIDIIRDPFARPEAKAEPVTLQENAPVTTTPAEVIRDSLSGDYEGMDNLVAADTLRTLGYEMAEVSRDTNTASTGKQWSVKIGGRSLRLSSNEPLGTFMRKNGVTSDTLAASIKAKGSDLEGLIRELPESEAKTRYLSEVGNRDAVAGVEAEGAYFEGQNQLADEFIQRIDRAESPEHLGELAKEAYDTKYSSLPQELQDRIFNKLDEMDQRFYPGNGPLKDSRTLAMERAGGSAGMLKPDNVTPISSRMKPQVDLLNAQGRPMRGEQAQPLDMLKPTPGNPADLEIPRPFEQAPKPAAAPETVQPAPTAAGEMVNPVKPRTPELELAAQQQGFKLVDIAEFQRLVQERFPGQAQHSLNVLEAAKNNHTLSTTHSPLEEGGRVVNKREISPVDLAVKTIKGKTEVSNLRKELGQNNFEAIRDNLVQRLSAEGVTVNAQDQRIPANPRSAVSQLNKLADMLPERARTYPYIVDHNFGETARTGPFGFRRLDRVTESSLTGRAQQLPEGAYSNQIAPAFKALSDLALQSESPLFKRAVNQLQKGTISRQTVRELKAELGKNADLAAQFCKALGMKL